MVSKVEDRAHRQAKPLHGFHNFGYVGKPVWRKREDNFVDVVVPVDPFCDLLKGIDRCVVDSDCLTRKVHVTLDSTKGERPVNQSVCHSTGELVRPHNQNTAGIPESGVVVNENSKYGAHRQGHKKQNHAAEGKEEAREISVKVEEKQQSKEHGIGSHAGREGGLDPCTLAKELLHACDPVAFGSDGPNNRCEQHQVEITVLVNPGIRVPRQPPDVCGSHKRKERQNVGHHS